MRISRRAYNELYGPSIGDRLRLADTDLILEIERSLVLPGEELVFGGGKVVRDGMGQSPSGTNRENVMDLVITNATVLDPTLKQVIKADIGVKNGCVVGLGHAGNPSTMADVNLVVGAGTDIVSAEGLIATPGFIDTHIHLISPQQVSHGLSAGFTTLIGGGTGPSEGTNATTCTPGPYNIHRMLEAAEGLPINFGILAKGNSTKREGLEEQVEAGAMGFKIHEDWGSTPAVIDCCLSVADEYDVQVAIHTDTLNEAGFVEDTVASFRGRTIHTYHTEGAGGGHAPDILKVAGEPNVLPSSTNPTRPFTVNTLDEHLDMLMVCHNLNSNVPEDVAFAESRIRPETMAAEDYLHDIGAISMMSSDSQAMGRVGETGIRTFQTAHKMKMIRNRLPEEEGANDNFRIMRYLAKLTINPAITHGISSYVGSIAKGKLADIVLWEPAFFGVKPKMIIKSGIISWSLMGDPNASIPRVQPITYRPMFGSLNDGLRSLCLTFVSKASLAKSIGKKLSLRRRLVAVANTRKLGKKDMVHNNITPHIDVDPDSYTVKVDGETVSNTPAIEELPLTQRYFLY